MQSSSKSKRIAIADDDFAILDALKLILEQEDYEVILLQDKQSLKELYKNPPGLIFLDIWMGNINGGDVCRALKTNKSTKHIPVVLMSANGESKKIAKESHADDYLEKPFNMSEFLQKVRKYIP